MLIALLHKLVRQRYKRQGLISKRFDLNSCSIHYYESTPSSHLPALLLVHGLGTSSSTWINLLPFFVSRFHIYAIDLPGFGFSQVKGGGIFLSLSEHEKVLSVWIDRCTRERFTLLGHSLGGWLAARYALHNPQKVNQLILINTAGILYDGAERQGEMFNIKTTEDVRKLLDRLWFHYPWYFKPFVRAIEHDMKKRGVSELVASIRKEDFLNSGLNRLTMPVTLIWGKQDGLISHDTVEILSKAVRGLEVHYIDRCGHVPQLERPKDLISILRVSMNES